MIPMLALRLLGAGRWLKQAAAGALGLVRRYPWQAALIVALCLAGWLYRGKHAVERQRDAARAEIAAMIDASKVNRAAAEKQAHEQQAKLDTATKDATDAYQDGLATSRDATARYIAAHRLRAGPCDISAAGAATEGNNPGVPADLPADPPSVAISEADLQAFVDWLQIGVAAHNQAVAKIEAGAAIAGPGGR